MPINIHILTTSKNIQPYETELRSTAESAVSAVKKLLPIKDVDIVFYENPKGTIDEMGGIGGLTPNAHQVFISLNPNHPNFKHALKEELFFTLAHELCHTVRWQKQVEGDTLLEALIFEGLADHFAMEVTGRQKLLPWSRSLTHEQKEIFMKKAEQDWKKPTYDNDLWFFGSEPEKIPRWTGYTLGYCLVEDYLKKHPETSASKLVSADADLFVKND